MASITTPIIVFVPSMDLLRKAGSYDALNDLFSIPETELKANLVSNCSKVQIMRELDAIDDLLKNTEGMQKVGKEIAECVMPLLAPPELSTSDDIWALFHLAPMAAKALQASSADIKTTLDNTCSRIEKGNGVDNVETKFYMLVVLVKYSRATCLCDLHYAYVYAKQWSFLQIFEDDLGKRKRMVALELQSMNILFRKLAEKSDGRVVAQIDDSKFIEASQALDAVNSVYHSARELMELNPAYNLGSAFTKLVQDLEIGSSISDSGTTFVDTLLQFNPLYQLGKALSKLFG